MKHEREWMFFVVQPSKPVSVRFACEWRSFMANHSCVCVYKRGHRADDDRLRLTNSSLHYAICPACYLRPITCRIIRMWGIWHSCSYKVSIPITTFKNMKLKLNIRERKHIKGTACGDIQGLTGKARQTIPCEKLIKFLTGVRRTRKAGLKES